MPSRGEVAHQHRRRQAAVDLELAERSRLAALEPSCSLRSVARILMFHGVGLLGEVVAEQHRERVRLLAARARRAPDVEPLDRRHGPRISSGRISSRSGLQRVHVAEERRLVGGHRLDDLGAQRSRRRRDQALRPARRPSRDPPGGRSAPDESRRGTPCRASSTIADSLRTRSRRKSNWVAVMVLIATLNFPTRAHRPTRLRDRRPDLVERQDSVGEAGVDDGARHAPHDAASPRPGRRSGPPARVERGAPVSGRPGPCR